ncbi:MAG: dTMP kinase [Actinobacteria bacterium]|jgi:dTMP kinase|nr:dTMP kinase [Actinomycetota bacterium]MCL6094346.1 dTMP kinase [Actinomycetota bacterium]
MLPGRLIAVEGGEGCGKSTQAKLLAHELKAVLSREPGGTSVGERIRGILLDKASIELVPRTELLLLLAARAQHVNEVVLPALRAGRSVVVDRFSGSTLAYQGYGRGLPLEEVRYMAEWAAHGLWPDLNILLDVPADIAHARMGGDLDRMEALGEEFHRRVLDGYRRLALMDPDRWVVIDGSGSVQEVASLVRDAVKERLSL